MNLKQQMVQAHRMLAQTPIPAMPTEVLQLQAKFAASDFPDLGEIAAIIARNTVLTGELIKAANKPQFVHNKAEEIDTIRGAVDVLGLEQLKSLVVGLAFKAQLQDLAFEGVIEHSLEVAKVAAVLSEQVEGVEPAVIYMAGLFHNAGAIMLTLKDPSYEDIFFNTLTNCYSGLKKELEQYHVSHGVFGLLVAKKWQLNNKISQVILMHHQRRLETINHTEIRTMIALIQLASGLVSEVSFGAYMGDEVRFMIKNAQQELCLTSQVIDDVRMGIVSNSL